MQVRYLFGSGVDTAAYASRVCVGATEIGNHTYDENCDYLLRRINDHHESVLEHVVYSFEIKDISRALLQQISRHRHISLSVQSTRWALKKVAAEGSTLISMPGELDGEEEDEYGEVMWQAVELALKLSRKYGNDVGKYALPECFYTMLVMTVNLRQLRHMYRLRTHSSALGEFRDLMVAMVNTLPTRERELVTA